MSRSFVRITSVAAFAAALAAPDAAEAQRRDDWDVPPGHRPADGQCRIWVDGVPPGRQPAPMDCATAVRMKPRNARVVYGGETILVDGKKPKKGKGRKHRERDDWYDRDDDRDGRWERDDCIDRNGDRRCDPIGIGTRSLPEMIGVVIGGVPRSAEQRRWLGRTDVRARVLDADRDRRAERVSWYDAGGRLVQVWLDSDHDGRADAVRMYERGRLVRVVN